MDGGNLGFAKLTSLTTHFLKVLALGADAVYLGSSTLLALAHDQILNTIPFEPLTQAIWYNGKFREKFKIEDGAKAAEKFLTACTEEMKIALRAMGKRLGNAL